MKQKGKLKYSSYNRINSLFYFFRAISETPSKASAKTYIQSLESQLNSEKLARLKLEGEINEIKKINQEISDKLHSSNGFNAA